MSKSLELRNLQLIRRGRGAVSPFPASEDFAHDCWQASETLPPDPSEHYYTFLRAGEEVCRAIVIDHAPGEPPVASGVPAGYVEVYFIEVASGYRRQGYGSAAIGLLRREYPGRIFAAFAEGGAEAAFWRSLGWGRYDDLPGSPGRLPLFIGR